MLSDLIDEFRDNIKLEDYFSYINFEIIKESIISSKSNIIFLLGEPGSGKSFMLNYLYKNFENYILIKDSFSSKEEFLKLAGDIENKKLLIDEAQYLDIKMLEYLRVLSDRGNQVIFAMHKKEGRYKKYKQHCGNIAVVNLLKKWKPARQIRYWKKLSLSVGKYQVRDNGFGL